MNQQTYFEQFVGDVERGEQWAIVSVNTGRAKGYYASEQAAREDLERRVPDNQQSLNYIICQVPDGTGILVHPF